MRNFIPVAILSLIMVSINGCAPAPAKIMAEPVSQLPYMDMSCSELDTEFRIARAQLEASEEKQRSARRKSIFLNLLFLGAGAFVDGPQKDVATSKGTINALNELIGTKCATVPDR